MPALMGFVSDLIDAGLAWYRLSAFDHVHYPPLENIHWPDELGLKCDEQVTVVAFVLQPGFGEYSQGLHQQRQSEAFVTAGSPKP
jgi:hypothetical protein